MISLDYWGKPWWMQGPNTRYVVAQDLLDTDIRSAAVVEVRGCLTKKPGLEIDLDAAAVDFVDDA